MKKERSAKFGQELWDILDQNPHIIKESIANVQKENVLQKKNIIRKINIIEKFCLIFIF